MQEPSSIALRRIRQLLIGILGCVLVIAGVLAYVFAPGLIVLALIGLVVYALPIVLPMIWEARKEYLQYRPQPRGFEVPLKDAGEDKGSR